MRQHIHICRKPRNAIQGRRVQPAGFRMLAQLQLATRDAADEALHAQMKRGVIPFYGVQQLAHLHLHAQLLTNLPRHGIPRSFTRFNLAPGKLPAPAVLMLRAFHRQHLALIIQDESRHHLHYPKILHHARHCSTTPARWQTHTDTAGVFSSLQRRGKSVE